MNLNDLMDMPIDELKHHGINGQKWGVKHGPPYPLPSNPFRRKKKKQEDSKPQAEKKKKKKEPIDAEKRNDMKKASKNRRNLSDEELRKRIERIEMERKLKTLTDEELSPGKKAVKEVLSSAGKKTAQTIVSGAMLYGAKVALTKTFDPKDAADYMMPKPKIKK